MKIVSSVRRLSFFVIIALIGLFAAVIGFGKTFFVPVARGTFDAPLAIHIHGGFAFAWITLFKIQPVLIHFDNYRLPQYLGILGVLIAGGVTITMVPAGVFVVNRELKLGLGDFSYSNLLGVITSGLIFFLLVLAGVSNREKPYIHKRLMLDCRTICVLLFLFQQCIPVLQRNLRSETTR